MFLILCLLCTSVSCNSIKIKYLPYENNIERRNKMDFCTQSNVLLFSLLSAQFSKQSHHRSHPKLPTTHHSIHKISSIKPDPPRFSPKSQTTQTSIRYRSKTSMTKSSRMQSVAPSFSSSSFTTTSSSSSFNKQAGLS